MRFGHRTCAAIRSLLLACLISLICSFPLMAIDFPEVSAVFALGAQQGSTYTAGILGQNLNNAYAIWFDCADLSARIKSVEPTDPASKDQKGDGDTSKQRIFGEVVVSRQAKFGAHFLRVVTPGGLDRLIKPGRSDRDIVDELFLAAFARMPSEREFAGVEDLASRRPREEAMSSLRWALVSSREFAYNH